MVCDRLDIFIGLKKICEFRRFQTHCCRCIKSSILATQSGFRNICEKMGRSKALAQFERGTVIGCHRCNKSVCEISSLSPNEL